MREGDVVDDRFEIERAAGTGGMGVVYRAHDRKRRMPVALKVLNAIGRTQTERFAREALVLSELRHPHIVEYVGHGETREGEPYLVMEWLEGEDLHRRLGREGLTLRESVTLCRRVAEALGAAHARSVVHRDVKTKNLLLVDKEVARVKLLDFGVARLTELASSLTATGLMLGTPGYIAPEQARGSRSIDARADVFALGCVLFRCLTGRPAFTGEDMVAVLAKVLFEPATRVCELRPDVPPELDALVDQLLAKDASSRPRDGAVVAARLEAIEAALPGEGSRAPTHSPPALLTGSEQRLVSVVVAEIGAHVQDEDTVSRDAPSEQTTGGRLSAAIAHFGARMETLANGCVVALLQGGGSATDLAVQAARCALAVRGAVHDVPIALATGRGEVGARWSMGEVIDRAVTLLHESRPTGGSASPSVRLDDITAGLLDARFDVRADAVGFELGGERAVPGAARMLLGKPVPCVGRDRELRTLGALLEECVNEPVARAVLITGASGIGKSRLRYEFVRSVRRDEAVQIWIARGDPMSAGSPLGMLAQMIRAAAGIHDAEPLAIKQRKLRARLSTRFAGPDLVRMTEFVGEVTQIPAGESAQLRAARRDAIVMGDQMRRAWEALVEAECSERPLLLVLEDLHWGDWPSVRFLDSMLRTLHDRPVMVLALARPNVHDLFPGLWEGRSVTEIALSALTRKAGERLVREVLGEQASAETVARLVDHAEGNAFYLEELIRGAAEGRGELPPTVLAMIQTRLEGLPTEARRVLRAASVFGESFWDDGVIALLGGKSHAGETGRWLADLVSRELLTRRGQTKIPGLDEYVFRHALVRETAYAMLTDSDRALGHRLAGEWLERSGAGDPMALAEHFERGKCPERAVVWFVHATEQALAGNDFPAVISRAQRGVACGAKGETLAALLMRQAEAHRWRGEFAEAESVGLRAMELLPTGSADWCFVAGGVAMSHGQRGDAPRLLALTRTLCEQDVGEDVQGRLVVAIARAAMHILAAGHYDEVAPLVERMDRIVREMRAAEVESVAWIDRVRASIALYEGDLPAFLRYTEQAIPLFEEVGDVRTACMQRENLGDAYKELGVYDRAEALLREASAAADRMGLYNATGVADLNLGLVLARSGRLDEARAVETRAVEAFHAQDARRLEGGARAYLATIHLLRGDLDAADEEARAAIEVLAPVPPLRPLALSTLSRIEAARGRSSEALAAARDAMALLESLGQVEEGEALVRLSYAEALEGGGDHEGARNAVRSARDRVLARAAKIKDDRLRASFLENVPDNARTLELAKRWGVSP